MTYLRDKNCGNIFSEGLCKGNFLGGLVDGV